MLLLIITIVFAVLLVLIVATLLIHVDISLRLVKEGDLAELRMVVGFLKGALSGRIDFSHDKREF